LPIDSWGIKALHWRSAVPIWMSRCPTITAGNMQSSQSTSTRWRSGMRTAG